MPAERRTFSDFTEFRVRTNGLRPLIMPAERRTFSDEKYAAIAFSRRKQLIMPAERRTFSDLRSPRRVCLNMRLIMPAERRTFSDSLVGDDGLRSECPDNARGEAYFLRPPRLTRS